MPIKPREIKDASEYGSVWDAMIEADGMNVIHTEIPRKPLNNAQAMVKGLRAACEKLEVCGIAEHIKPGDRVLEIGCGPGFNMLPLAASSVDIIGLDVSCEAVMHGQRMRNALDSSRLPIYCASTGVVKNEFAECFDVVFELIVFQHLRKPDVQNIFKDVRELLKPGGKFVFQMLRETSARKREWIGTEESRPVPCMRAYAYGEVVGMLLDAGLECISSINVNDDWFVVEAIRI